VTVTLSAWHFASTTQRCLTTRAVTLEADRWCDDHVQLLEFDRQVHRWEDELALPLAIAITGEDTNVRVVERQFPLRYQRLFAVRNGASAEPRFDRLLRAHAELHDRSKPLVRADHDHAIDVWQWTLRLAPDASEALQIAALFHDIERLISEADVRIEHAASDYVAFKQSHARSGAALVARVLAKLALPDDVAARACALVERHEQPEDDAEIALLNDADALSWFALNSPGFLAYFGREHTAKKVAYTLARMRSTRAKQLLREVRLEREVALLLAAHA
jgi:hypothetical protein